MLRPGAQDTKKVHITEVLLTTVCTNTFNRKERSVSVFEEVLFSFFALINQMDQTTFHFLIAKYLRFVLF